MQEHQVRLSHSSVNVAYVDTRNHWGASAVDGLSTAILMEEQEIVREILNYIKTIDFKYTGKTRVSLFETTIRYIAGMLSAYDLLQEPGLAYLAPKSAVVTLLKQTITLTNTMTYTFDQSTTGIPHNDLYPHNKTDNGLTSNGLATTGSLILEWGRLSDITDEQKYRLLTAKAQSYLLKPEPAAAEPFPGLLGTRINIETGKFEDASGGWGASTDSFYEYLIKMYVYDPVRYNSYKDRWVLAASSTMEYLASHPGSNPDLTFLSSYTGTRTVQISGHLACFAGGNFVLGGSVLNRQDYIDFGLNLTAGCHHTYKSMRSKIGPASWSWNVRNDTEGMPEHNTHFNVSNPEYDLRPEVIESYYYAYRITGNQMYRDWAWEAFVAINETCRTEYGFSALSDVRRSDGGHMKDTTESFLFAEVLKYAYLIQTSDDVWQVNSKGGNTYVFNTEAHPLKVAGPPA